MKKRDYPTLNVDTNLSKGTACKEGHGRLSKDCDI